MQRRPVHLPRRGWHCQGVFPSDGEPSGLFRAKHATRALAELHVPSLRNPPSRGITYWSCFTFAMPTLIEQILNQRGQLFLFTRRTSLPTPPIPASLKACNDLCAAATPATGLRNRLAAPEGRIYQEGSSIRKTWAVRARLLVHFNKVERWLRLHPLGVPVWASFQAHLLSCAVSPLRVASPA